MSCASAFNLERGYLLNNTINQPLTSEIQGFDSVMSIPAMPIYTEQTRKRYTYILAEKSSYFRFRNKMKSHMKISLFSFH